MTTALSSGLFSLLAAAAPVAAQSAPASRSFDIAPQPLASALRQFADQSGMQLAYRTAELRGINSPGFRGSAANAQALSRLLAGTGIDYRASGANTVTIQRPATTGSTGAAPEGAIALDTINVSGGGGSGLFGGGNPETPYSTPAPTAFISQESIERFRGSSPADIFRGVPGVMSGEARNGGGGIDPNIRGMQGMGRVAVTIDGAENGLSIYQGYQGISNRTFLDPDLIGGVDITKGSSVSSRGIAGTVAVRTINADEVVKPGEKFGIIVKSGFGTNTGTPSPGARGGYLWQQPTLWQPGLWPVTQMEGRDRPGLLEPTSGSGSVIVAWKDDDFDLLAGYARRKQGNYFAGSSGRSAQPIGTGPRLFCYSSGTCLPPTFTGTYTNYFLNGGLTSYRKGEEVLNTSLDTESFIAKGTYRFGDGHALQLGYNGFRSEAGDILASRFSSPLSQAIEQQQTTNTKVDSWTARYRWKPTDNDLIDVKANLWLTDLRLRGPIRGGAASRFPEDVGLARNYRTGNDVRMWGGDVSNTSRWTWDPLGSFEFDYGVSYLREATHPTAYTDYLNFFSSRVGNREEASGYGKLSYKPFDWLTLNGGLRFTHYRSNDLATPVPGALNNNPKPMREDQGFSPSVGVLVEPWKGTQFYANYSNALRMPSLFETVSNVGLIVNESIKPERSRNWEIGTNLIKDNVFADTDKAMLKFGYFNWDVKDYVARFMRSFQGPGYVYTGLQISNIPRARFEGLEMSARYEYNGFTADLSANYYLNVEFCQTVGKCNDRTISGDYATNQIPPEYQVSFTASQKFLNDTLTIGGRVTHVGPRSIGHGDPVYGAQALIAQVKWKPYYTVDAFAEYKLSKDLTAWANVENLADTYYVDPLSLVPLPAPGRTIRVGLTGKFGGNEPFSGLSLASLFSKSGKTDWSGLYLGGHTGYSHTEFRGTMTAANGSTAGYPSLETPNQNGRGFVFGANAGYNHQFGGGIVAGIEGDIAKPQIGVSQYTYATEGSKGPYSDNLLRLRQLAASRTTDVEWLSTIRGRLGYALTDNLLVYATGGIAFMKHNEQRMQFIGVRAGEGLFTPIGTTAPFFTENVSATRVGYVIGGGAEYAMGGGWSVKGEYLLASFEDKTFSFPGAKAGVMIANGYNYPVTSTETTGRKLLSKVDVPVVKFGVNYRF